MDEPAVVTFLKSLFHLHDWHAETRAWDGIDGRHVYIGVSVCSTCGKVRGKWPS